MNFLEKDKELVKSQGMKSSLTSELKPKELRILLIGKTGDGKSATGNTILGKKEFKSINRMSSITKHCQFGKAERYGRTIVVVDTPGLCDTHFPSDVIKKELIRSVGYASPGFHAIVFVLAATRYTKECVQVRDQFFEWFGKDVSNYSLILISRGDEVDDRENYLKHAPPAMDEFLKTCNGRYMFFNNRASGEEAERQIVAFIHRIDTIIKDNKGFYFSNIAFRLAKTYERVLQMPVYKWVLEKVQSLGIAAEEPAQKKPDLQQDSSDADRATFEQASDEVYEHTDQLSGSSERSGEVLESFLEEQINDFDTADIPKSKETPQTDVQMVTKTSQIDEDDQPKLRDQLRKPGFFEKFLGFFTNVYDKYMMKVMKKRTEQHLKQNKLQ